MPPPPLHPGKEKSCTNRHPEARAFIFPPFSLLSSRGPIRYFIADDVVRGKTFLELSLKIFFLDAFLKIFSLKNP